jgi:hypothetical protein
MCQAFGQRSFRAIIKLKYVNFFNLRILIFIYFLSFFPYFFFLFYFFILLLSIFIPFGDLFLSLYINTNQNLYCKSYKPCAQYISTASTKYIIHIILYAYVSIEMLHYPATYIVQIVCIYSVYTLYYKNQFQINNTNCCNAVYYNTNCCNAVYYNTNCCNAAYYRIDVQPMCSSGKKSKKIIRSVAKLPY